MTITYSYSVANASMCGFGKLLFRWKGSIYKLMYREMLIFISLYTLLSTTYRYALNSYQKRIFEKIALYCHTYTDLIPLSFVFGFYVALIVGRWWQQYNAIPWPDTLFVKVGAYVIGDDERGFTIRRTMMRYVNLMLVLTLQGTSISVKKRFPTLDHLVEAGLMTKEDLRMMDSIPNRHGKWWYPCIWFSTLAVRARKENRIRDDYFLDRLLVDLEDFRGKCGLLFAFDWISVPLVYTQVATLALYTFFLATIMGRQYLDPSQNYPGRDVDLYIPLFTILQFFFYMGWLKVAEQLINPFGEDDDDFEMNWIIDRNFQASFMACDCMYNKLPKLQKDYYWGDVEFDIPYTKQTTKMKGEPFMGSTVNLDIPPEDMGFVPMETILEADVDEEADDYDSSALDDDDGDDSKRNKDKVSYTGRNGSANALLLPSKATKNSKFKRKDEKVLLQNLDALKKIDIFKDLEKIKLVADMVTAPLRKHSSNASQHLISQVSDDLETGNFGITMPPETPVKNNLLPSYQGKSLRGGSITAAHQQSLQPVTQQQSSAFMKSSRSFFGSIKSLMPAAGGGSVFHLPFLYNKPPSSTLHHRISSTTTMANGLPPLQGSDVYYRHQSMYPAVTGTEILTQHQRSSLQNDKSYGSIRRQQRAQAETDATPAENPLISATPFVNSDSQRQLQNYLRHTKSNPRRHKLLSAPNFDGPTTITTIPLANLRTHISSPVTISSAMNFKADDKVIETTTVAKNDNVSDTEDDARNDMDLEDYTVRRARQQQKRLSRAIKQMEEAAEKAANQEALESGNLEHDSDKDHICIKKSTAPINIPKQSMSNKAKMDAAAINRKKGLLPLPPPKKSIFKAATTTGSQTLRDLINQAAATATGTPTSGIRRKKKKLFPTPSGSLNASSYKRSLTSTVIQPHELLSVIQEQQSSSTADPTTSNAARDIGDQTSVRVIDEIKHPATDVVTVSKAANYKVKTADPVKKSPFKGLIITTGGKGGGNSFLSTKAVDNADNYRKSSPKNDQETSVTNSLTAQENDNLSLANDEDEDDGLDDEDVEEEEDLIDVGEGEEEDEDEEDNEEEEEEEYGEDVHRKDVSGGVRRIFGRRYVRNSFVDESRPSKILAPHLTSKATSDTRKNTTSNTYEEQWERLGPGLRPHRDTENSSSTDFFRSCYPGDEEEYDDGDHRGLRLPPSSFVSHHMLVGSCPPDYVFSLDHGTALASAPSKPTNFIPCITPQPLSGDFLQPTPTSGDSGTANDDEEISNQKLEPDSTSHSVIDFNPDEVEEEELSGDFLMMPPDELLSSAKHDNIDGDKQAIDLNASNQDTLTAPPPVLRQTPSWITKRPDDPLTPATSIIKIFDGRENKLKDLFNTQTLMIDHLGAIDVTNVPFAPSTQISTLKKRGTSFTTVVLAGANPGRVHAKSSHDVNNHHSNHPDGYDTQNAQCLAVELCDPVKFNSFVPSQTHPSGNAHIDDDYSLVLPVSNPHSTTAPSHSFKPFDFVEGVKTEASETENYYRRNSSPSKLVNRVSLNNIAPNDHGRPISPVPSSPASADAQAAAWWEEKEKPELYLIQDSYLTVDNSFHDSPHSRSPAIVSRRKRNSYSFARNTHAVCHRTMTTPKVSWVSNNANPKSNISSSHDRVNEITVSSRSLSTHGLDHCRVLRADIETLDGLELPMHEEPNDDIIGWGNGKLVKKLNVGPLARLFGGKRRNHVVGGLRFQPNHLNGDVQSSRGVKISSINSAVLPTSLSANSFTYQNTVFVSAAPSQMHIFPSSTPHRSLSCTGAAAPCTRPALITPMDYMKPRGSPKSTIDINTLQSSSSTEAMNTTTDTLSFITPNKQSCPTSFADANDFFGNALNFDSKLPEPLFMSTPHPKGHVNIEQDEFYPLEITHYQSPLHCNHDTLVNGSAIIITATTSNPMPLFSKFQKVSKDSSLAESKESDNDVIDEDTSCTAPLIYPYQGTVTSTNP